LSYLVYSGVLLRTRRAGGRGAVSHSHLLWAELDRGDSIERLRALTAPPTMTIASGTAGHAHAYWRLDEEIDADRVAGHNRRLALSLDADLSAVDAARILRPPDTLNHTRQPPSRVELIDADPVRRYHLAELLEAFPAAPTLRSSAAALAPRVGRSALDEELLTIPAVDYVRRLTGREPDRTGKIACPFHPDRTPSLQLYGDGGFYCFGCGVGGSLYDFGAALWGLGTKGRDFLELRERLLHVFGR
jgi:CHC2-type zinc finger protein